MLFDDDGDLFDSALAAGTAYALFRHGQDAQTAALLSGGIGGGAEIHIHTGDDEQAVAFVNALDFATADMPDTWDDYIGQEPMKRQIAVYMKSAQARGDRFPHTLLASGYPGVGKGHDLDTQILTPDGWQRLGDLLVGDEVIGSDGQPTVITDIYKRGTLPLWRVTFSDGSSVRCDPEHLWQVQTIKQRQTGRWQTLSTQELAAMGLTNSQGRPNFYIPMVAPVEHTEPELPVEPYLLGVMLGNAEFAKGVISLHKEDRDVADRIITAGTEMMQYPTTTALRFRPCRANQLLRAIGQEGVPSKDKHIPPVYLTAHLEARRALLAGLLDTDGSVRTNRGQPQFHTTSLALAGGVQTLVESLGGTARVRVLSRGEIRVDILLNENPFRSDRKRALWRVPTRGPSRSIIAIEPEGEEEVWCLRVAAADHLYVTERYLVTHNTTLARLIAKTMNVRIVELVPPFNVYALVEAASTLNDGDILFIDEIHKLADSGKRGAEILLKVLEDRVAFLPTGEVIELADITVIGATTDRDKLPEPVIDRFKVKPFFQPYSHPELGEIAITFAARHKALDCVDDMLAVTIAKACRGTPRISEELVMAARDLTFALGRPPSGEELLDFVEIEPDGLTRQHIQYLTSLRQFFPRTVRDTEEVEYIVGEAAMQQILRETKPGIGRIENFLIERGLIDRTPRGRRLTPAGIARAETFIREGKGASSSTA